MTLIRCFDAATPPLSAPPGCGAVLGYIGRGGFTPHVWTPAEWRRFDTLLQFPCYVPSLDSQPRDEARNACALARELGWGDHLPAEMTRAIVFDFETASGTAAAEWWAACSDEIHVQGYAGVAYGSEATVFSLAASWVWLAAWDGAVRLGEGQTVVAHQYASTAAADYSVISPWLAARGGHGPRHG